jgi:hypothetical protein
LIGDIDMDHLLVNIQKMEKEIGREINYVLYTPQEFNAKKEAENAFILDILACFKINCLKAVRRTWGRRNSRFDFARLDLAALSLAP